MPRPSVTDRARLYLAKMEAPRRAKEDPQDSHTVVFQAACVLVNGYAMDAAAALPILREYAARSDMPWTEQELVHKLNSAGTGGTMQRRGYLLADNGAGGSAYVAAAAPAATKPAKPEFDAETLRRVAGEWAGRVNVTWLANRSVEDPALVDSAGFLRMLYGEGERVVCFTESRSQGQALWPDESPPLAGPKGVWFLAQPVDGETYPNPRTGKPSRRSEESVTSFRYLVLESDLADPREWLGALAQVPLRIEALYTSGGRSIHALVRVDAPTKKAWDDEKAAMGPALTLLGWCGADPAAQTAVRLTRLPQALRGRKRQRLLYVRPHAPLRPLIDLPRVRDVEEDWAKLAAAGIADSDETGGKWLFDGLRFYAGASARLAKALETLNLMRSNA